MGEFVIKEEDTVYWFGIIYLLEQQLYEHDKCWDNFSAEISYNNRFSPKNEIISEIDKNIDTAQRIISKGKVLYRARIYDKSLFEAWIQEYDKIEPLSKEDRVEVKEFIKAHHSMLCSFLESIDRDDAVLKKMDNPAVESFLKWKKKKFKGYNAKDSLPPPKELVTAGRANPDKIRYLYLCEDETTPIYEVRPIIGQIVSVAKLKTLCDLKIFDFTKLVPKDTDNLLPTLFETISNRFSVPYSGNKTEYLPTQYISEHIKNLGFNGICFASSLNEGGKNIVLFDVDTCKPVSSTLKEIKSISINIESPNLLKR